MGVCVCVWFPCISLKLIRCNGLPCSLEHRCKNIHIKIKDVKKVKNVTKIKKTFANVIKTLPLLLHMAFKATRNMSFSLVQSHDAMRQQNK